MSSDSNKILKCAVYTRKSSEEGLEQQFNSLDAQREACEAYILSQRHEGWRLIESHYDDGGFSGGNMERPGLVQLLADIKARKVDVVVVYKVDRLTRALADFAKIVETFDAQGVSFVSITQQFNTTTSMGRLTLNVLLSFAQFEREVTGERIRDKIAASRLKGMWMGGSIPLGYDVKDQRYVVNPEEADAVRLVFAKYLELGCVRALQADLKRRGLKTKVRAYESGKSSGGQWFSRGHIYYLLNNRTYLGDAVHKGQSYPNAHEPIITKEQWEKVQSLLATNKVDKVMGRSAKDPSLLAGLIFDDLGHRLTPSHSLRRGIRYRYYISQPLLQNLQDKVGSVRRLPAAQIEGLVKSQVASLFKDSRRLLAELAASESSDQKKTLMDSVRRLATKFDGGRSSAAHELLRSIVTKVIVGPDHVVIQVSKKSLRVALGLQNESAQATGVAESNSNPDGNIELIVNARLKRSGRESKMLIGEYEYDAKDRKVNEAMIETIKCAHAWNAEFLAGKSTAVIGKVSGRHRGYVAAVLPLAFLAPDITSAILEGRQPPRLTTKKMLRHVPVAWTEQRKVFGFPPA
jgi:site-specific DNA recombinase